MTKEGKPSYNDLIIPNDSGLATGKGSPSLLDSLYKRGTVVQGNSSDCFAPASPKKDEKKAAAAPTDKKGVPLTSQNYQKAYLDRMRTEGLEAQQKKKEAEADLYRKQSKENDRIHEMRNQAHAIQEEMRMWESMRGQGTHDDQTIDGQIEILRSRLANIPPQYQF